MRPAGCCFRKYRPAPAGEANMGSFGPHGRQTRFHTGSQKSFARSNRKRLPVEGAAAFADRPPMSFPALERPFLLQKIQRFVDAFESSGQTVLHDNPQRHGPVNIMDHPVSPF